MSLESLKRFRLDILSPTDLRRYWAAHGTALLKGKTVLFVGWAPMPDCRERAPSIVFTDGSVLVLQSDPEGNGPGAGAFRDTRKDGTFIDECLPPV